jgi:D-alanyl-D-alanine carboxypeptidase
MAIPMLGGARRLQTTLVAMLCAALPLAAGVAQSTQQLSRDVVAARVDSMVRVYMADKGPASISVAISRANEMLVQQAWGVADVGTGRPATPATVYMIGSVSKQFTTVLILRQVERGKLALTDSLGRYLTTGLRPEWRALPIEQVLNHTSGLQNDLRREGRPEELVTSETMIAWAARDTMPSPPGTRFAYSNVGYLLLGALIEKLYGKPYGDALQEEIAGPLGLRSLGRCIERGKNPAMATGHVYHGPGKNEPAPFAHPSKSLGSGGICATAEDLAAWNRALHGGRVLAPASYAAMITPRGAARGYGFGMYVTTTPWGAPVLYHLGSVVGFSAQNAWFPSDSLSVTVLHNSQGRGLPSTFILELARAISASAAPKPASDTAARPE